jgi:hypothetical protein
MFGQLLPNKNKNVTVPHRTFGMPRASKHGPREDDDAGAVIRGPAGKGRAHHVTRVVYFPWALAGTRVPSPFRLSAARLLRASCRMPMTEQMPQRSPVCVRYPSAVRYS